MTAAEARALLDSDVLTVDAKAVAVLLGVSPFTIYESVKRGTSPIAPIMVGRCQRYRVADLRRLLGLEPT